MLKAFFMLVRVIILFHFLFSGFSTEDGWVLKKDKEGIKIYTQLFPQSSFKAFQAITIFENTSQNELLGILMDVEGYPMIFPDLKDAKIVLKRGEDYQLQYLKYDAPWPVSDRDGYYEQYVRVDPGNNKVTLNINAAQEKYSKDPDYVRMEEGHGYWSLEDMGEGKVKVVYEFHPDPGGMIPAWLANSVIVNNPFQTLVNLRKYLEMN